jgi:hypothetical protein
MAVVQPGEGAVSDPVHDYRVPGIARTSMTAIESDEMDEHQKRSGELVGFLLARKAALIARA